MSVDKLMVSFLKAFADENGLRMPPPQTMDSILNQYEDELSSSFSRAFSAISGTQGTSQPLCEVAVQDQAGLQQEEEGCAQSPS